MLGSAQIHFSQVWLHLPANDLREEENVKRQWRQQKPMNTKWHGQRSGELLIIMGKRNSQQMNREMYYLTYYETDKMGANFHKSILWHFGQYMTKPMEISWNGDSTKVDDRGGLHVYQDKVSFSLIQFLWWLFWFDTYTDYAILKSWNHNQSHCLYKP